MAENVGKEGGSFVELVAAQSASALKTPVVITPLQAPVSPGAKVSGGPSSSGSSTGSGGSTKK